MLFTPLARQAIRVRLPPDMATILIRYPSLTPTQQDIYREILPKIAAGNSSIKIVSAGTTDDVFASYRAVRQDYPELFWLGGKLQVIKETSGYSTNTTLILETAMDSRSIARAKRVIERELHSLVRSISRGAPSYDKVRMAYEYVIQRTTYDRTAPNGQNMTGVFVDRRSVCAGYSEAFCFLLRSMGVPCGCITGHANSGSYNSEPHQWNIALIDGVATLIDPTWGDPVYFATNGKRLPEDISYRYLCVTEDELQRTHDPDDNQTIPSCESRLYDWFLRRNLLLDTFSTYEMDSLLYKAIIQGKKSLEVKFSSHYDYGQAVEYIESGEIFAGRFGEKLRPAARKSRQISISHDCDNNLQIVQLSW